MRDGSRLGSSNPNECARYLASLGSPYQPSTSPTAHHRLQAQCFQSLVAADLRFGQPLRGYLRRRCFTRSRGPTKYGGTAYRNCALMSTARVLLQSGCGNQHRSTGVRRGYLLMMTCNALWRVSPDRCRTVRLCLSETMVWYRSVGLLMLDHISNGWLRQWGSKRPVTLSIS